MLQNPLFLLTFDKVHNPLRLPRGTTSKPSKVVQACRVFNILTWKSASRHNGVHFFSRAEVLCTFWLGNLLRTTTACTFSTSQLPKVLRTWCVLYILTSKCASGHNSVHFFDISTSRSGLLFDPPEPQIIGKTQCFATFVPFRAPGSSFFWLSPFWSSFFFYSLLWLFPSLLFICPYCRKFDF